MRRTTYTLAAMRSFIAFALFFLGACGNGASEAPPAPRNRPAPRTDPSPRPAASYPRWLREVLAYDLSAVATDRRTTALGQRLRATVACPQPGTGCFVELPLAGVVTQLHLADDQAIQIWGPLEPSEMAAWVEGVEREIDGSDMDPVNATGARPDRLWRTSRRVVLLHDHTGLPCSGFCPSMLWIARPTHPSAPGYGFADPT